MHDIDRTRAEFEWDIAPSGEYEFEATADTLGESEYGYEFESTLDEAEVMELAAELLEVTTEAELDQFIGNLFKKVSNSVGKLIKSPIGKTLGGVLKGVAQKALPIAGAALGSVVPGLGTALGGSLGSMAGSMFGMELEGLSGEDQEFEVAKRYVQFASEAAKQAATAPANVPPQQVTNQALTVAAQKYAPGLLSNGSTAQPGGSGKQRSGRWIRRGNNIILIGAR
jgi:uncharacterized protein (DUF697 family)